MHPHQDVWNTLREQCSERNAQHGNGDVNKNETSKSQYSSTSGSYKMKSKRKANLISTSQFDA